MKRHLLTILAVLLCSLTASAHDFVVGDIYYNITPSMTVAVTYRGSTNQEYSNEYSGAVTIPSTVTYSNVTYSVTSIRPYAFKNCSSLTTINIPESVTSIGEDAFLGCSSLTNINIPEKITSIRTGTFKDCKSLTTITIPEGVTNIEDYAFGGCKFDCIAIYAPTLLEIGEHYAWPDQFRTKMLLVPYNLLDDYVNSDWNEYCWEINSFGYISNPSFEEEDTYDCNNGTGHGNLFAPEGWQVTYTNADWGWKNFQPVTDSNGQDGNRYFEFWAATYHTLDLSQKLYSLPAGTYILSAAMRTEKAEQVTNQHIYAKVGDKTYESVTLGAPIGSAWNAVDAWQTLSVEFTLDEASPVTIGATSTGGTESKGWFQIDNFRLSGASTNIALNQTAITINIEETATLTATMSSSSNVAPPTVTWTSSNTAVAIVDANGKVTAKGAGTATITAKAGEKSATCMVTVKTVFINNISLNQNSAVMSKNETLTLSATITPSNTTDKTVTWSSSNSAIASVDNNGKVTAKSAGAATITAKAGGKTATCEVNIKGWDFDYATGHLIVNDNYDYASSQDYPWSNVLGAVASVEFGPLATMIGSHALMNCTGLTTATIANSVTSIGIEAFKGCTGLTNINFPNQLTTIGANAFEKCTGLVNIALPNSLVTINRSAFKGCTGIVTVNFGEGVRIISDNSFENCTGLKFITIPNSVRTIQASIFANCDGLIRVTIPNSVTSIGSNAFADCDGLESITIPNSVTTIGTGAFNNCDGLLSIAIPYSVTNIGDNAFAGCDMLESVIIGDGVTIIGSSAFANCHAMSELTIGYSVTTIGASAFSGCEALTSVIIPNSVTNIASAAFANCKGLNSVTIGEQVKEIQNGAFEGCEKLKTVINLSKLIIEKGSTKHGYVAYYANVVMTEGLFLNLEELKLTVGENTTLKATLVPEGSNNVRWSTSNSAVATVNEGKVTAKSAGTATITATAGDKTATCVVTVEKKEQPQLTSGEYYLYNAATKQFLSRGEYWGTCATVDKYGIPFVWTAEEYSLKFLDSNVYLYETDDSNLYTDNTSTGFIFEEVEGGYLLKSQKSSRYLTIVDGAYTHQIVNVTDDANAATLWQPMTKAEHDAHVAGYVEENYANVIAAAGISATAGDFAGYLATLTTEDKTSVIGTARFSGNAGEWKFTEIRHQDWQPAYGTDFCELWQATGHYTQTITGLVAGIYKVTMQGFERAGGPAECNTLAEQGYEITTATLSANGEEVNLKPWYSGKSGDNNPDNTAQAVTKFDEGEYMNEIYTYVGADGTLTITVNKPSHVGNNWVLFNNFTLTHYIAAPEDEVIAVSGITLDQTEATLTEGETLPLVASVLPDGATDKTVTWETSDAAIATVADGVVTAVAPGVATITAKAGDKTATCVVTVEQKVNSVSGITLNQTTATLTEGETLPLVASVSPDDATDKTITWATSDAAIATVADGVVTAVATGTATITAQAGDKTATCVVTVEKKEQPQLTSGEYYLYNAATKQFLSRGEYWGTCATVDKYGIPFVWTAEEYSLKFLDSNVYLYETDDSNLYTDNTSTGFIFEEVEGGYLLKSQKSSRYLTIVDGAYTHQTVNVTDDANAATLWQPMTKAEHDAHVAGYVEENYANVIAAAGISATTGDFAGYLATLTTEDKTSAIGTARFSGSAGNWTFTEIRSQAWQPAYGTDFCELWQATGHYTQTITGLVAGIYKVTMQGFERAGGPAECNALAEQGYEITTATLSANGEEVNLKSWYSGKSGDNNPDNTAQAVAKFDEGEYMNEIYTYVGADGTLTITVNKPSHVGSNWVLFNNFTLTHYIAAPEDEVIAVSGITLDQTEATLTEGETLFLTATVSPSNATDQTVTWNSSNTNVATVDNNGKVKAIAEGYAIITATAGDKQATCTVTVNKQTIAVSKITLNQTTAKLVEGEVVLLTATVNPENATDNVVTWTTSNSEVATVDEEGVVIAISKGTAIITAKADGKSAKCVVTVEATEDSMDIENPEIKNQKSEFIYDLTGRRVMNVEGLKGMYIVNGKKVIFK